MVAIAKGKYQQVSAENYEDFLKALDVNFLLRKAATASTPEMSVTEENGVWEIKTSTFMKSMELKFQPGVAYNETTPDGRDVMTLVTLDGNKFISEQTAKKEGQKSTKTVRDFSDTGCKVTMEVLGSGVSCLQIFKRL